MNDENSENFILDNTLIMSPPLCPEMKLHLLRPNAPLKRLPPDLYYGDGVCPYWAYAWGAGQALARYILDHPETVTGKRVHDCGAGSGIAGIAAALAGAVIVEISDFDAAAVTSIRMNASLNDVVVTALQQDFRTLTDTGFDLLIIGDVFYKNLETIWIETLMTEERVILVSNPLKRQCPEFDAVRLGRYEVRTFPEIEQSAIREAVVLQLHPPRVGATNLDPNP